MMPNSHQIKFRSSHYAILSLTMLVLLLLFAGCAIPYTIGFSKGTLEFKSLSYPTSMSGYLYGPDAKIISIGNGLKSMSRFSYEKRYWGIVYSFVELSNNTDYADAMNRAIKEADGDGMVNVEITAEVGALHYVLILNLLPVWPTYSIITVQGDIVRYEKRDNIQL